MHKNVNNAIFSPPPPPTSSSALMPLAKEITPPLSQTAFLDPCSLSRLSLKQDPHGYDLHEYYDSRQLINFKAGADHRRSSAAYSSTPAVLSFDGDHGSLSWINDMIITDDEPITADAACFRMIQEKGSHKRPSMDDEMQDSKKNCWNGRKHANKAKECPSKDLQSIAAKNRRERISERLKILQDLVPNGKKVDLVTMLEKAITYVKFLQLQVKVLNTDEFWPAAGGKVPEASQVKEAINAILSSHRGRNSSFY